MIDGLKLILTGRELQTLLEQRIEVHRRRVARWNHERERTPNEETVEAPLLPDHLCECEAERHEWRVEVLAFIRDHIDPGEAYRLGEADLASAELLPEKPWWLEQEEYEERTSIGFNLGRLVKKVSIVPGA